MTYISVKKKIIISSLISIVLLVIGIFLINSTHKVVKSTVSKGGYEVKAQGVKYPFGIALGKGRTYLDAIALLEPTKSIEHIYKKNGSSGEEVDKNEVITQDVSLKVD